ncbi:hypothetical protein [Nocardioides limicola]|uniref:hypothetical protein n=1 Tax=Nocardioides limicola TaxID=2803368 RepID=UPI00193C380B|nr:hypothetical protein [Nocardioides sp. DJM-14]
MVAPALTPAQSAVTEALAEWWPFLLVVGLLLLTLGYFLRVLRRPDTLQIPDRVASEQESLDGDLAEPQFGALTAGQAPPVPAAAPPLDEPGAAHQTAAEQATEPIKAGTAPPADPAPLDAEPPPEPHLVLQRAQEGAAATQEALASLTGNARAPILAAGLEVALSGLARSKPIPVVAAVVLPPLPPAVESAVYLSVAQCLDNTVRHAQATRAWIRAEHDGERLRLGVGDDGIGGVDVSGPTLTRVVRRVVEVRGKVEVQSPPGGPTLVSFEIPCSPRDY